MTIFAFALVAFTANAQLIINGDLNYDGDLNITDVMKMIDIILGNSPKTYLNCPDDNHPHMIDLGLPSGTKWACCNVGADKPEAYGGYYAWGETEEKDCYDWSTYILCDGDYKNCYDLGSDIAGTKYDVAHVKWGGSWVMPSREQQEELKNNCVYEWTIVNDVNGCKFTSKISGGSIFLPASGYRLSSVLNNAGGSGDYWSSTPYPSDLVNTICLYFNWGGSWWNTGGRDHGFSVRPVSK